MILDSKGGKWYKGNLHTHTTNSDGRLTPQEAAEAYKAHGYDFLSLTDHWVKSEPSEYGGMLLIPGIEYDVIHNDSCFHVVGHFMNGSPKLDKSNSAQEIIDAVKSFGGTVTLAHPAWSLQKPHEMAALENVDFTEIYNSVSGYPYSPRPYSGTLIDVAAAMGFRATLTAVDDTHYYEDDAFRGFVYVKADSLTEEAIRAALLKGDVLATEGPFAEWTVEDGYFKVHIPGGCEHVQFFSSRYYNPDTTVKGGTVCDAVYKIKSNDRFVRAEIVGFDKKTAYTQYHFIDGGSR